MASIANLNVMLSANVSRFAAGLAKASKPLDTFVGKVAGLGMKIGGLAAAGGALVGVGSLAGGLGLGIKLAAEYEQATVAMGTLLGSTEAAKTMLADLNNFAASTPFNFPELQESATKLIAFGESQENIIPTLRALGDVAAGVGMSLNDLAEMYGKNRVQGIISAQDINQMTGRGIPIIGELAKQFGVAESEIKGMVSSGKVNFSHLQKAFVSLTAEGGKFAGMMDAQSKTLTGVFSTLQDNVGLMLRDVAMMLMDGIDLKGLLNQFNDAMPIIQAVTQAAATFAVEGLGKVSQWMATLNGEGGKTGNIVITAMELGAKGVAYLLDMVDAAVYGYRMLQLGVAKFQRFVFTGYQKLLSLAAKLPDWMGGGLASNVSGIADMFAANLDAEIKTLEGKINKSLTKPSNAEQVTAWFSQVKQQAAATASQTDKVAASIKLIEPGPGLANVNKDLEKVSATLADLQSRVESFGLTDAQRQLAELTKLGASDEEIAKAKSLLEQLEKLDAAKRRQDELTRAGQLIFDATRSPMEKYETRIGELSDLLNAGAIDWDTYGRAVRSAREELEGAAGAGTPQAPQMIRWGSAQARRFAFDSSQGMRQLRDDLPKKTLAKQTEANSILEDIRRNTARINIQSVGQVVEVMEF